MALIISRSNQDAIEKYWKILNIINLVLIPSVFLVWFLAPSLTKNLKSSPQLILRIISVAFSISGSGVILFSSNELTKLKPKIDSLHKRENAQFKHELAADLLEAQKVNEMIVENAIGRNRAELDPYQVSPETPSYNELSEFEAGELQSYPPNSEHANSELDITNEPYFDAVIEALEDEINESKIIKDIMGFRGANYRKGKAILAQIKEMCEIA